MTADLFDDVDPDQRSLVLAPGATLLRGFASDAARRLLDEAEAVAAVAPFRRMEKPGGLAMAVAMTNCGTFGWVSDRAGYRYVREDPCTGRPWPPMHACFLSLATAAASCAGYPDFRPDACLINRYAPGTRLSLHQDRDERDFAAPIVSVSLGLPAVFLFGGERRRDRPARVPLRHGDVVVWGGPSRLRFHGVEPVGSGNHPATGAWRVNLTFRMAQ
ncbi:MAG: DNA oxidative demethylase AlkB [Betaproteobacteria bacterium]|nr:DNA oxidative demethylase AlkB [Betaproteobacteria bacterium]